VEDEVQNMVERRALKMRGRKIGLAVLEKTDLPLFKKWLNDPRLSIFMREFDEMLADENIQEWYEKSIHDVDQVDFSIVNMKSGQLVGACTLTNIDGRNSTAEARLFIGESQFWNKGYGSEALILLLDYAFNVLNLHNVCLHVNSINKNAIHVYEKLGFKLVGKLRERRTYLRNRYDLYIMDILAREFDENHKSWIAEIIETTSSS
jgi:RimJ/RimL family protein N-acetyltransferase